MKKKNKSASQRKADERQRKREQGLVRKEIWILPKHWEKIKQYIEKLHN